MSTEQNKSIVRNYMQALNTGNLAALDDYLSREVVFNGEKDFRQQLDGMFSLLRNIFPDLHIAIEGQIAEGDMVVTRVTFSGTHQGPYGNIAPTGRQVTWTGVAIDRIADGKVVEMWHCSDDLGMLRQLGAEIG